MSDLWATPPEVFEALDKEFCFGFDVCAEYETAKCSDYWAIDDDALSMNWAEDAKSRIPGVGLVEMGAIWCNPPYSNPFPFIKKAVEAQLNGRLVVMLLNHDMSCDWGRYLLPYVTEIRVLVASGDKKEKTYENGRLAFLKNGIPVSSNPKGQAIFIFDPHRVGYCHTTYVAKTSLIEKGLSHA